ncbi:MAG: DUF454 family protein, partial [Planctomycetes bacterium]|nr:DUF454 family protein [Planctomycetota bacterium]
MVQSGRLEESDPAEEELLRSSELDESLESAPLESAGVDANRDAGHDFRHEVGLARSKIARALFGLSGSVLLALAIVGAFLPLLPTTPFLLLAAGCYGRASTRFYNRLLNDRVFGSTIRVWRAHRGVPRRSRRVATVVVPVVFAISIWTVP